MNRLTTGMAALILNAGLFGQAAADEYYLHLDSTAVGTPKTINISTINTTQAVNHKRVVHDLIVTNADTVDPVTVTFFKITNTSASQSSTPQTISVIIVPANSTKIIPMQSGLSFLKKSASAMDQMQVELTTPSTSPSVSLTLDYQDLAP